MKLREIRHQGDYRFLITFKNGESEMTDLSDLISRYVTPQNVSTAHVNEIESKTLYSYAKSHSTQIH